MQPYSPKLLLTRPKVAAERFAELFRARFGADWPVVISPLMATDWVAGWPNLRGGTGVIFTSETAVRGFAREFLRRDIPAYCVGPRTAEAARGQGFVVHTGPGDALGLAALIAETAGRGPLLYPHGREIARDIEKPLNSAGIVTISFVAYQQRAIDLTGEARQVLLSREPVLVPLFSARSATLFVKAAEGHRCRLLIAAISHEVGQVARGLDPEGLKVAQHPQGAAMVEALDDLANSGGLG